MPQDPCFDAPQIALARIKLSWFMRDLAAETAHELGFGWRPSMRAPSTLGELTAEFRACQISGLPLRVSSQHCDQTIYASPADNIAFRFVHDSRHVFLQAGFDLEPELLVAGCHVARLHHAGFTADSIESRLLYADTAGQALFLATTGVYVVDQLRFGLRCLVNGIKEAIDLEYQAQLGLAS